MYILWLINCVSTGIGSIGLVHSSFFPNKVTTNRCLLYGGMFFFGLMLNELIYNVVGVS